MMVEAESWRTLIRHVTNMPWLPGERLTILGDDGARQTMRRAHWPEVLRRCRSRRRATDRPSWRPPGWDRRSSTLTLGRAFPEAQMTSRHPRRPEDVPAFGPVDVRTTRGGGGRRRELAGYQPQA